MSQVGRISGPLLEANLLRDNDLAFETDLLYFDITNNRIGVKTDAPSHDADIVGTTKINNAVVNTTALFDNVYFNSNGTISSYSGPVVVAPQGADPYLEFNRLNTDKLSIKGNLIKSYEEPNGDIVLRASGTGEVIFEDNTTVQGNLETTGDISINGNLASVGNIIVGDSIYDVVVVVPDFTQSLIPGVDNFWSLGIDANDSAQRRWAEVYVADVYFDQTPNPDQLIISDQLLIDGNTRTLTTLQSNDTLLLNSDSGIIDTESVRFQNNTITNLDNTPLTLTSTGIGYVKFTGTAGVAIPYGTNAERPITWGVAEAGATRWNTELGYLECWDGSTWIISTGPGVEITEAQMEELGHIYTLMLG